MLEHQHREVEGLFEDLARARSDSSRRKAFERIADALFVHLAVKRVIADLLPLRPDDDIFAAKVKVLQDEVDHHVEEEERDLFPKVRKLFDAAALNAIGEAMAATRAQLVAAGDPRYAVTAETEHAAPL